MVTKKNKLVLFLLVFLLILAAFPLVSFGANPTFSQSQIVFHGSTRYYDATGLEVIASPVLGGNAVVSVAKTIEGTDTENQFLISLKVRTSVDVSELNMNGNTADVWRITDPMGENIEFISSIPQIDNDTGLLSFDKGTNTLLWNLKNASPSSFANSIYTYTYSYRIRLDTTSKTFVPDRTYETNGQTGLQYVMLVNGVITGDVMTANLSTPTVEGYAGDFGFTKVGDNTQILAGCKFTLVNQNKADHYFTSVSEAITGEVSFSNIPSGHTYTLSETYMPDDYQDIYFQSDAVYTATVSYGQVTIRDSGGNVVNDDFTFNNPSLGKPRKKVSDNSEAAVNGSAVKVGDKITYDISYTNGETSAATIVIEDKLPVGVDYVESTKDGVYDEASHTVTWTLTDVPSDSGGFVSVVVKVNDEAVLKIENEATVQVGYNDPQTSNNVQNMVKGSESSSPSPEGNDISAAPDSDSVPKTGDSSNPWLWIVTIIVSFSILVLIECKKRRRIWRSGR